MSTVFTIWCRTDEEAGPKLQRTAGGSGLIDQAAWSAWLIEHEYHELVLEHE
jgi:hypothetical protein